MVQPQRDVERGHPVDPRDFLYLLSARFTSHRQNRRHLLRRGFQCPKDLLGEGHHGASSPATIAPIPGTTDLCGSIHHRRGHSIGLAVSTPFPIYRAAILEPT